MALSEHLKKLARESYHRRKNDPEVKRRQAERRASGCFKAYHARYHKKNRTRINAYKAQHYRENREVILARTRRRHQGIKDEAFARYGGYVCKCCGETIREFLSIDHIDGGWSQIQKQEGNRGQLYRWLKRHGYPEGFRVLCHNCNQGRQLNGGICPHERLRNAATELERPVDYAGGAGTPGDDGKSEPNVRTPKGLGGGK